MTMLSAILLASALGLFNVRDFGAKGDGKASDSAAIQRALDAAGACQGTVYFPAGVYRAHGLKAHPGICLKAERKWEWQPRADAHNQGAVLLLDDFSASSLLDITGARGIRLEGLVFDGGFGDGYGFSVQGHGTRSAPLPSRKWDRAFPSKTHGVMFHQDRFSDTEDSISILDCRFIRFPGNGLHIKCGWVVLVNRSQCAFNRGSGLDLIAWDGVISETHFSGNGTDGLALQGAAFIITGNRFEWNARYGLWAEKGDSHVIGNCQFDRNGCANLFLSKTGAMSVSGNLFRRAGESCRWEKKCEHPTAQAVLLNCTGLTVCGNTSLAGADDKPNGKVGPEYGFILEGLTDSVVKDNSFHRGYTSELLLDRGGHRGGTVIRDNPGCACELRSPRPYARVGKPVFCLPKRLYAAPGLECNVYFKEVFDSSVPENYAIQARCAKGRSERVRWTFTPNAEDAGKAFELTLFAWNDDGLVTQAKTTVCVAPKAKDPSRDVSVAILGDSLTNSGFQQFLYDDMKAAGLTGYRQVGSRGGTGKHDGYGGFSFRTFLTRYMISDEEYANVQDAAEREQLKALGTPEKIIHDWQRDLLRSPLVQFKDGKKVVDVQAWLDKVNGGKAPDYVVIELGVNSIFGCFGEDGELKAYYAEHVVPQFEELVSKLRETMPGAVYVLCTQPVGTTQDGFANNYGSGFNEVQHRKNMFQLTREIMRYVEEKNDPKVRLLPVAQAVDPIDGFIREECPTSARAKTKTVRSMNAVHPSAVGGAQMGDAIAAGLRQFIADDSAPGDGGKEGER